MLVRTISVVVATLGLSLAAYLVLDRVGPREIPFADAERVAEGAALYSEHCASCHGMNLEGEEGWESPDAEGFYPAPPQDEHGHAWHHADVLLFDLVKRGPEDVVGEGYRSRMPGFEGTLSDAEILSTLAYIKSTWPLAILEVHNVVNGKPGSAGVRLEDLEACGITLGVVAVRGERS